jgi:hypothetical protein
MTDATIAQTGHVLVAIDIAKARHEVLIAVPGRKRRRRLTVLNQLEDFDRLITTLLDYDRPVRAAFEATGNYHRALAYRLGNAGFDVKLVSSVPSQQVLQNSIVQHRIGKQALEPGVLFFHRLQLCDVGHLHAAILRLEFVERALAETVLAAHFRRWHPGFLFLDHPNDLGFCETALSHSFAPSKG